MKRARLLTIVLLLGAIGFGAAALYVGGTVLPISWYRLDAPDMLSIEVTTGLDEWTRITSVDETDSSVVIVVKSSSFAVGPQASVGKRTELLVRLKAPLAGRRVVDGTDQPVPPFAPPQQ
jgi:hypothetical protein